MSFIFRQNYIVRLPNLSSNLSYAILSVNYPDYDENVTPDGPLSKLFNKKTLLYFLKNLFPQVLLSLYRIKPTENIPQRVYADDALSNVPVNALKNLPT